MVWFCYQYQILISSCTIPLIYNDNLLGYSHNIHATIASVYKSGHASCYYSFQVWELWKTSYLFLIFRNIIESPSAMEASQKRWSFQMDVSLIFPCLIAQLCSLFRIGSCYYILMGNWKQWLIASEWIVEESPFNFIYSLLFIW